VYYASIDHPSREGQPWHKSDSRSEGIRSYRWKSRCRLLRNQLRLRRPASRRTEPHPLPSRSPNPWSSGAGIVPLIMMINANHEELARTLKHEGVRAGEIIAYRAWRVINEGWFRSGYDRLHSVLMKDYVWHPDEPAFGDVRTYGIYSFREVIRSREEYGYDPGVDGPLLFGKVKIWGEIVEHEEGYRSEFGKIASLDSGDPELLDKFRKIYRVNHGRPVAR
jgi:hypothetical protein